MTAAAVPPPGPSAVPSSVPEVLRDFLRRKWKCKWAQAEYDDRMQFIKKQQEIFQFFS